ncbi:MAG: DUF3999 family protein [Methylomonas sp.]
MIAKFILMAGLLFAQVHASDITGYRFSRPVVNQDGGQLSLLAVPLDDRVYAGTADGLRDLRLTDQNGVEIPFLLQKIAGSKTVIRRLPSRSDAPALQKSGEDGIVITVALDKEAANADGLTVVTGQRDFEYDLRIEGSNDGKDWQTLVDHVLIYDYSRYMAVGNRDIELPGNSYRQFRLVVAKATQTRAAELLALTRTLNNGEERQRSEKIDLLNEPLHIDRIEFWHKKAETLPETEQVFDYPVTGFRVRQDAERKMSVIDIESGRQPLTGFRLTSTTTNFSRNVEVEIPLRQGIETRMQVIGSATLEALHFQDIHREQSLVSFPEQRRTQYQIIIRNQDNPPLEIRSVTGLGPGYQLLFLQQPGQHYQLKYGSDKAESPRYDTVQIQELLRRGYHASIAELGPETADAAAKEEFDYGEFFNSQWFLGAAIGLMVLVLGWSLYRVGKRVGELPK